MSSPIFDATFVDLDDADRAYDKWAEHRNGHSRLDAFRAGVEFGLRHTAPPSARIAELEARPVASAGLIEAATLERYARSIAMWCYRENVTDFERLSYIVNHPVTRRYAKRARATDRSGK